MLKLSGVIITFNEEKNIEKCLSSLSKVVDEIVVVDSFSTDNTKTICQKFNVHFIEQEFLGYIEQKNFALAQAKYDHIVALDGDEALSEPLQKSILALKSNWVYEGYYANRLNKLGEQWIKHTTWYPDKKLRIFDRRKAKWTGTNPHDRIRLLDGTMKTGFLKGDILHTNYQTYSEHNQQIEKFTTIAAEAYFKKGKKASLFKIIINPTWAFFQSYIIKLGFLDGFNGFYISVQTANIRFLKYAKLRELQKKA
ncbi:glycosyltransferase family 2 protein [Winogradskyella arenosi]|uniref:Glycosyltransferase involved in cell wall biosynthesis n=1 Tax=Winogradskyella arenosi TaxID=533325 RepID=A0A368ZFB8_9FLAO|nr:glycosyltransferase family 2 protein [Winogradskyella arenosi]RCW92216.1 glycosyltransferase involved in cell wall biosynthesis [Winogradskyella arenosi]